MDDAIVVVENFHRHRVLGEPADRALSTSLGEITHALLGSTLTPVAVLLPLGLLSGVPGAFFRPLAVTMTVALLVSLVLALSFTPALAATLESGEYGGLYASQQKAFAELLLVFFASIGCVTGLLLVEFGSIAAAVAIVIGSSLALSGSLAGLWATDTALNVSSIVGMIMVVGIVAKNGILLLDFAGREYAQTGDLEAALGG